MLSGAMVNAAQHRQLVMRPDGRCYVMPNSGGSEYDEQPVSRTYQYRKVSFAVLLGGRLRTSDKIDDKMVIK